MFVTQVSGFIHELDYIRRALGRKLDKLKHASTIMITSNNGAMMALATDANMTINPEASLYVPESRVHSYRQNVAEPVRHASGTIVTDGVVMDDGFAYAVVAGIPRDAITGLSIGLTSAWWTSSRGHNRRTVEHFMRLGIPTVFVGAEASYRPSKGEMPESVDPDEHHVSLARSAHNTNAIFDSIANEGLNRSVDTQNMILLGESRGAMVGKGILWLAKQHDRNIVYGDLTAPCFPEKFELHTVKDLLKQIYGERAALATLASTLTMKRLIHYPATIDLHPDSVCANLATWWPLFSGDAGIMGRSVPKMQALHVTTFKDDLVSMPDVWREIYANHPLVRIKEIDGAHLTIAHPKTMEHLERRIFALLREVDHKGSNNPADLDFSRVHLADGEAPFET